MRLSRNWRNGINSCILVPPANTQPNPLNTLNPLRADLKVKRYLRFVELTMKVEHFQPTTKIATKSKKHIQNPSRGQVNQANTFCFKIVCTAPSIRRVNRIYRTSYSRVWIDGRLDSNMMKLSRNWKNWIISCMVVSPANKQPIPLNPIRAYLKVKRYLRSRIHCKCSEICSIAAPHSN